MAADAAIAHVPAHFNASVEAEIENSKEGPCTEAASGPGFDSDLRLNVVISRLPFPVTDLSNKAITKARYK